MHRGLIVVLALTACDEPSATSTAPPPTSVRSGAVPEMAPPIVCEPALPLLQSEGQLGIAWLDPPSWLRWIDTAVPVSPTRTLLVGQYGDFYAEGMFVLAFEDDGTTAWDAQLPAAEELWQPLVQPRPDGAWIVGRELASSGVWRYDADGSAVVATSIDGLGAHEILPTPGGGLLLLGLEPDLSTPRFAELSEAGAVLWQDSLNLVSMDRVHAEGVVQRLDPMGVVQWEHDPRPEPFAGFPLDLGATWARLAASGEAVAHGRQLAEGGSAAVMLRIAADGRSAWSVLRPRVTIGQARLLTDERLLVHGASWECTRQYYAAIFDVDGEPVVEGRSESPVIGLDTQGRVLVFTGVDTGTIALEWIAEVPA